MSDALPMTVRLERRGANYTGPCPLCFSPAMAMTPARLVYHCFHCGLGSQITDEAQVEMLGIFCPAGFDSQWPSHLTLRVHSEDKLRQDRQQSRKKLFENVLVNMKRALSPQYTAFIERGEVVCVTSDEVTVAFSKHETVAMDFLARNLPDIERRLHKIFQRPMKMLLMNGAA